MPRQVAVLILSDSTEMSLLTNCRYFNDNENRSENEQQGRKCLTMTPIVNPQIESSEYVIYISLFRQEVKILFQMGITRIFN